MTSKLLGHISRRHFATAGTVIGLFGITTMIRRKPLKAEEATISPADEQFHTASKFPVPSGYSGDRFQLKIDYPVMYDAGFGTTQGRASKWPILPAPGERGPLTEEAPWLRKDFTDPKQAYDYCSLVKEYCWEGNSNNDFRIERNKIRQWYHAPWMHYSANGREPINGLTYERATPPKEISATQQRFLQNWACGYYNAAGASVFGHVWRDPSNPGWTTDVQFPQGTCVFKILLTDASDDEIPSLKGSPSLQGVFAKEVSTSTPWTCGERNDFVSKVRLTQVDFAVRDDRAPIGWVFGTFMYDSECKEQNPLDRIIPVGLMWGNDPKLNQAAFDRGERPSESWINPRADEIRKRLGGSRPSWGWNGRMNGPADNFISFCASCHSVSGWPDTEPDGSPIQMTQPRPTYDPKTNKWTPVYDKKTMNWFRNIPGGQSFWPHQASGDYSLQLMMGMRNYQNWLQDERNKYELSLTKLFSRGTKYTFGGDWNRRTGPTMNYEDVPPCNSDIKTE